jgi:XTP/dITP diphosphohydrolase
MSVKLLIATRNRHKFGEFIDLLGLPAEAVTCAADRSDLPEVEENGQTFAANAIHKAITWATVTRTWVLADDSGLAVRALNGAPGVFSARFAGPNAPDADNNRRLLELMNGVTDRRACFKCALALVSPSGDLRVIEGACPGVILHQPRGKQGFGYDPLFVPNGFDQTFAEIEASAKNRISHRARALQALRTAWPDCLHQFLAPTP